MNNYVAMEKNVCEICGQIFDTGSILIDKRLKDLDEKKTVTGYGRCESCNELVEEYLTLVVVDESKSGASPEGNIKQENAYRTGELIRVKRTAIDKIFDIGDEEKTLPIMFIGMEVAEHLRSIAV